MSGYPYTVHIVCIGTSLNPQCRDMLSLQLVSEVGGSLEVKTG